jgi:hypothetical protein
MKPEHRSFFIKLRALCAEHKAEILLSSDGEWMVFRFDKYTRDDKSYKLNAVFPSVTVFAYSDVREEILCDEEPKP